MKIKICDMPQCYEIIEVPDDYEPEFCCSGYQCGCHGYSINPLFCDACEVKLGRISEDTHEKED